MSARQQRKRTQAKVRHNNAWNWRFDRFVRAVVAAHTPLAKAFESAYERSRNERDV